MDFRPNTNILVLNYLITFGVVGGLLYFSIGNPTRFYYSPKHNSHAGYESDPQSCRQCHINPWEKFDERTCWTGGCHTQFDPTAGPADDKILALREDESGMTKPHFGAVIAMHREIGPSVSCNSCHPSHQLPQTGLFNAVTIHQETAERLLKHPDASDQEKLGLRTEIFHNNAELFIGKISCQSCHLEARETTLRVLNSQF